MKQTGYYLEDDVLNGKADNEFRNNSVIKIKNLFDKDFCDEVLTI